VANVVMLGALAVLTNIVTPKAMEKAVLRNVPTGTEKLNTAAFERGLEYGRQLLKNH
jgi:2-oxoglutarate ferredoxin oxidoreductase subunit gamma